MNEKLQFSWGHIMAFLALIAVSYISFVGFTYLTDGNFTFALIGMGITDVVFILFFIGAQQMKASGVKMGRKIIWERIFIFGSPIVFIAGMISMSHFWTVRSQNDEIVNTFRKSINNSKHLFDDYEYYSDLRIQNYNKMLAMFIAEPGKYPTKFRAAGLKPTKAEIQRQNMVETLRLQLRSENYDNLKTSAIKWIEKSDKGASTCNIFLLGNMREIREALINWENELKRFSAKEMSNESLLGDVPFFSSDKVKEAIAGIDSLTQSYTTLKLPTPAAIFFGIVIYLLLLFPYFLQDRHTKNVYRLTGSESKTNHKKVKSARPRKTSPKEPYGYSTDDEDAESLNLEENNDYPSF